MALFPRFSTVKAKRLVLRYPVRSIALLLAFVYLLCILTLMIAEGHSLTESILILMPSIFGELGEVTDSPRDLVTVLSLAIYVCFLGLIFGKLSEMLMGLTLRGGIIVNKVNYDNHIVICGWNYQGPMIVRDLLDSDIHTQHHIVILADLEKSPLDSCDVDFIKGCPWRREDLTRAGIERAKTAIVLTDMRGGKTDNPDAEALMITLAVESMNRAVHTCVQLLHSENRIHLENAHADEIVCLDQTGGKLVTAAALHHGTSSIVTELLTFDQGSEFYKYDGPLSPDMIGVSFAEVGKWLLDQKMILVAIETANDQDVREQFKDDWIHHFDEAERIIIINPQGNYRLRQCDALFVIAESDPREKLQAWSLAQSS